MEQVCCLSFTTIAYNLLPWGTQEVNLWLIIQISLHFLIKKGLVFLEMTQSQLALYNTLLVHATLWTERGKWIWRISGAIWTLFASRIISILRIFEKCLPRQFNGHKEEECGVCRTWFSSFFSQLNVPVSSRSALTTPQAHTAIPASLVIMATPPVGHLWTVSPAPAHSIFLATSRCLKTPRLRMSAVCNQTLKSITAHAAASLGMLPMFLSIWPHAP